MPGSIRVQRNSHPNVPFPLVAGALLAAVVAVVSIRAAASGPSSPGTTGGRSGGGSSPGISPSSSPAVQLDPLPVCEYGSLLAARTAYRDWRITLLDTNFALPESYVPPVLVSTGRAGFEGGFLIRKVAVNDLAALREAAEAAGNPLGIVAAYRSYGQQAELFDKRKAELGYDRAILKTARPGHSEHQLGTTLDFKSKGAPDVNKNWGYSPTGRWVAGNAWRFGFVQSYPRNKSELSCYPYEPWHFRYVGRKLAAQIHDSGLTPREFLWRWDQEHPPSA
jgi:D-alanyl-D-alanine carboxypeptidase